jgi:ankyrin repeat protein
MIVNLQGQTPLYVAAYNGHAQLVELLTEKGADPNYSDVYVSTNYIRS